MGRLILRFLLPMNFSGRLSQLRKQHDLTQQKLADMVGMHVNQIKKYEAGTAQPTLTALISLVKALHVSLDDLVFGEEPRGPDERLRLQFEAICQFDEEDKQLTQGVLEGLILKHQAKQSVQRIASNNRSNP